MTFNDWMRESRRRFSEQPPKRAAKQSLHKFRMGAQRRLIGHLGKSIWSRDDWDVLVVLDAARRDLMEEAVTDYDDLPEQVPGVWSNASCSIDWIRRNFNDYPQQSANTGYVTANPFTHHNDPDSQSADLTTEDFAHLERLYKTHWQTTKHGIDTVPPRPVTDHAIHAWRNHDMNQLVVHYMQPHEPFRSRPEWGNGNHSLLENLVDEDAQAGASIYPRVQSGEISIAEFWQVYLDNLHWVLEDVTKRLLPNINGTVVLTADHGNALGEWGEWHHPGGAMSPPVRKVPWVEVECRDEHSVTPAVADSGEEDVEASVGDQLEALGYA